MKRVSIIGSDGFFASYGGWDQLINNIILLSKTDHLYHITQPIDSPIKAIASNLVITRSIFRGSGFLGMLLDIQGILNTFFKTDTFMLLGTKAFPIVYFLKMLFRRKIKIIVNTAGIEWERPQFSAITKIYLKFSYKLALKNANFIVLDNQHYIHKILNTFGMQPRSYSVIPYGGSIDYSLDINNELLNKYPFLNKPYFLSISRSIEDNKILDLCETFRDLNKDLVLISNFSNSDYGKRVLKSFNGYQNITLIDGLYNKPVLDLIRRCSIAYIHTHTLCGSAPSLIEMIVCNKPLLSIDIPQNRYTTNKECLLFKDFSELSEMLCDSDRLQSLKTPSQQLRDSYKWEQIVRKYEELF